MCVCVVSIIRVVVHSLIDYHHRVWIPFGKTYLNKGVRLGGMSATFLPAELSPNPNPQMEG